MIQHLPLYFSYTSVFSFTVFSYSLEQGCLIVIASALLFLFFYLKLIYLIMFVWVFSPNPCQMCSQGVDLLETQEIQRWGRVNQDLELDWDMDFDLNHNLVIFKLIMLLMHISRELSILASATLHREISRPWMLQISSAFL